MSFLLYAEPIRGAVTRIDINGQGAKARLDSGSPLRIRVEYKTQNPKTDPTDTVQLILFLGEKFLKCLYNNVPPSEPNYATGTFECKCTVPPEEGKYPISVGYGYNWNWPEQAYNYLLANPDRIRKIGELIVGPAPAAVSLLPLALVAVPIGIVIGTAVASKK